MPKHEIDDGLWNDINSLLVFMRSFEVVELVRNRYENECYDNAAPRMLLQDAVYRLQKRLDEAKRKESDANQAKT